MTTPVVQLCVPHAARLAPEVTVSHAALLLAVQAQPVPLDPVTVPVPPAAAIDALLGLIE